MWRIVALQLRRRTVCVRNRRMHPVRRPGRSQNKIDIVPFPPPRRGFEIRRFHFSRRNTWHVTRVLDSESSVGSARTCPASRVKSQTAVRIRPDSTGRADSASASSRSSSTQSRSCATTTDSVNPSFETSSKRRSARATGRPRPACGCSSSVWTTWSSGWDWPRRFPAARQMVVHGHIQVDGGKVDRPSYPRPARLADLAAREEP